MVKKDVTSKAENEKDALLDTALTLDNTCNSILRVLLEDKMLRFSEVQNFVSKISRLTITNRVLSRHLKHLINKNLVKRTEQGFQNVTYSLSDMFRAVTQLPKEDLLNYLKFEDNKLPLALRTLKIDIKEFYSKFLAGQIDQLTDRDLHDILSLNLWELKLCVDYDLSLKNGESDEAFWTFFANPTYRLHEKEVAEKCRYNNEYKKLLFEKIDILINQLRSDRELLRERNAKQSKK
jgi:hypothetical protein